MDSKWNDAKPDECTMRVWRFASVHVLLIEREGTHFRGNREALFYSENECSMVVKRRWERRGRQGNGGWGLNPSQQSGVRSLHWLVVLAKHGILRVWCTCAICSTLSFKPSSVPSVSLFVRKQQQFAKTETNNQGSSAVLRRQRERERERKEKRRPSVADVPCLGDRAPAMDRK